MHIPNILCPSHNLLSPFTPQSNPLASEPITISLTQPPFSANVHSDVEATLPGTKIS